MNYEEFLALLTDNPMPQPVMLADGRMGLCNHWTKTEALVDAYRGNDGEQVRIPFHRLVDIGGGCLLERQAAGFPESELLP